MRLGASAPGWSPRQALLLQAVDELHAQATIGDELWARLARDYREAAGPSRATRVMQAVAARRG
ncbi:MAG: hypothetical protein JWR63_3444 [Conexibacter sp.]|nr:hypothetical protein [Conexibacter sp.]